MRWGRKTVTLGLGIALCGGTLWGAPALVDMEARVRSKCFHCHGGGKLCQTTNDRVWWEHAVDRMVQYEDGLLRREEISAMAAWLADAANRQHWCTKTS